MSIQSKTYSKWPALSRAVGESGSTIIVFLLPIFMPVFVGVSFEALVGPLPVVVGFNVAWLFLPVVALIEAGVALQNRNDFLQCSKCDSILASNLGFNVYHFTVNEHDIWKRQVEIV